MTRRVRLVLFAFAGLGLAAVLLVGFHRLPHFGHAHELYGAVINRTEPTLRHATDIVTALNFDIRAFDTLGEEFILFVSVSGVALLLRHLRDEREQDQLTPGIEEHRFSGASDGLRLISLVLIPLLTWRLKRQASCSSRPISSKSPASSAARIGATPSLMACRASMVRESPVAVRTRCSRRMLAALRVLPVIYKARCSERSCSIAGESDTGVAATPSAPKRNTLTPP